MPNLTRETDHGAPRAPRFKIKATGDTGTAVSENGRPGLIGRLVSMGPKNNIRVIDLCDDASGEIRTYLAEKLEEVSD